MEVKSLEREEFEVFTGMLTEMAEAEKNNPPTPDAIDRIKGDIFSENPRCEVYLAKDEGETLGFAIIFWAYSSYLARPTLFIEDIFIKEEFRKQGIATNFIKFFKELAQKRGAGRIDWVVLDWNEPSLGLSRSIGAEEVNYRYFRIIRERFDS